MNRENLRLMAEYIATVSPGLFDMLHFRKGDRTTAKCGSVGCVLGHCTVLDPKPELITLYDNGRINFKMWSEEFTGLAFESPEWKFCFSPWWELVDNTPQGASNRILRLLDKGLPANWEYQLYGL